MQKILITAYFLDYGGIEKSLINLLKNIDLNKNEVTLVLQEKKGIFLKDVPSNIKVKEYKLSKNKCALIRKIMNRLHLIFYILLNYKKYDKSICYATYDIPSSILTRYLGKESIYFVHSNYKYVYKEDINKVKEFFNTRKIEKFDKIVFVSNESRKDLIEIYPNIKDKSQTINNIYSFEEIKEKSKEKIENFKEGKNLVFVGRLEEDSKALLRLLKVMKNFKENKEKINLYIIGDGEDKNLYDNYIKKEKLDNVYMLGSKRNPYPYIKKADVFVLPSNYEGFPVTVIEALTLKTKVVTTINVSSPKFNLEDYVFLCEKNEEDIYNKIIEAIKSKNKKVFNDKDFYNNVIKQTKKLLERK